VLVCTRSRLQKGETSERGSEISSQTWDKEPKSWKKEVETGGPIFGCRGAQRAVLIAA